MIPAAVFRTSEAGRRPASAAVLPALLLSHISDSLTASHDREVIVTSQAERTREEIIASNLAAVEVHFHNETPETIDKAVSVYTDDIVWEVPARGLVHRNVADVKAEYLKIFGSMNVHKITNLYRFATEEWVFDDSIFEWTITGDGFANCPFPPGTTVSVRLLHAFQCRDGKICRENGYEIWRDINDTARVRDDIPATATVEVFG
jgi:SnoaL-like protein